MGKRNRNKKTTMQKITLSELSITDLYTYQTILSEKEDGNMSQEEPNPNTEVNLRKVFEEIERRCNLEFVGEEKGEK